MNRRRHPHIIELLASLDQESGGEEVMLYLLFPWAPRTLDYWLRLEKTPPFPTALQNSVDGDVSSARHEVTYDVIYGLVSALSYLHKEIDGEATAHHDLKPTNILFSEADEVFKICDFGTSKLRSEGEGSGTSGVIGSPAYLAPEYYNYRGRKAQTRHGRSFDLYAMSCIILELATILVFGWKDEMVHQFEQCRKKNEKCRLNIEDEDEEWCADQDKSFHNNPKIVEHWIEILLSGSTSRNPNTATQFAGLIDLVRSLMTATGRERLYAWEFQLELIQLRDPGMSLEKFESHLAELVPDPPKSYIKGDRNPIDRVRNSSSKGAANIRTLCELGWDRPESLYFSSLPRAFEGGELIGRGSKRQEIQDAFDAGTKVVGLRGLGGSGYAISSPPHVVDIADHFIIRKSHTAFAYAKSCSQASAKRLSPNPMHTFWLQAASLETLINGYKRIADEARIETHALDPDSLIKKVKDWLENRLKGKWLLILDGLDSDPFSPPIEGPFENLKDFLPRAAQGQVLITTRINPAHSDLLRVNGVPKVVYLEDLSVRESITLFVESSRSRRSDGWNEWNEQLMMKLVERLQSPMLIKVAAMTLENGQNSELHELVVDLSKERIWKGWLERIEVYDPNRAGNDTRVKQMTLLSRLIQPFVHKKYRSSSSTSPTSITDHLYRLALLSKDHLDFDLQTTNFRDRQELRHLLRILKEHCALEANDKMHGLIQDCATFELIDLEGQKSLVYSLLDDVLCMLFVRYNVVRMQANEERRGEVPSWSLKVPFMPHLNRIVGVLKLVKDIRKAREADFEFTETAVKSVITFSRVLVVESRFADAEDLINLMLASKLRDSDVAWAQEKRSDLYRELAILYYIKAAGRNYKRLDLEKALQYAESALKEEHSLEIQIDICSFYRQLGKFDAAKQLLSRTEEDLNAHRKGLVKSKKDRRESKKVLIGISLERVRLKYEIGRSNRDYELLSSAYDDWHAIRRFMENVFPHGLFKRVDALMEQAQVCDYLPDKKEEGLELKKERIEILRELPNKFANGSKNVKQERICNAEVDAGLTLIHLRRFPEAAKVLSSAFEWFQEHLGLKDSFTRNAAYTLSYALVGLRDREQLSSLRQKFTNPLKPSVIKKRLLEYGMGADWNWAASGGFG